MELHEIIAIIVVSIAFMLFGIVVWILCRHHKAINRLNKTLLKLGRTDRIAIDVRDINIYVRIIAYIALVFCLGVVIHYLAIALPRIYEDKPLQNLGVDYLGLIVAIFAIIVTLLVTWNIYSTIKAKEELRFTKDEIEKHFENRIKRLETCCEQGKSRLGDLESKHDTLEQDTDKRIRNLRGNVLRLTAAAWSIDLIEFSKPALFRRMVNSSINSVNEHIQNKEIEQAGLVLSYILEHADELRGVVIISKDDKNIIINRFKGIANYSDIDNAEDFIEFISSITEP